MKFKSALKYQLLDVKRSIIIFYIVIIFLMLLLTAATLWFNSQISITEPENVRIEMSFGGATAIFLFVVGLNAYKSSFHMLTANGVSRKTMFGSFIVTALIITAGMALIDSLLALLLRQIIVYDVFIFDNYEMSIVTQFVSSLGTLMLGYLITTLYYRMSKPIKLLVSVGVPAMLIIVLPIMDASLFGYAITRAMSALYEFVTSTPAIAMVSRVAAFMLFGALAFLTLRRAPVKA